MKMQISAKPQILALSEMLTLVCFYEKAALRISQFPLFQSSSEIKNSR